MNILLIGSGAREHALAKAITASSERTQLFCIGSHINPGIQTLAQVNQIIDINHAELVRDFGKQHDAHIAIIGPESPLEAGVADYLWQSHIPTIGPKRALAKIETSKHFTRTLVNKHIPDANPNYRSFSDMQGVKAYLEQLANNYVIKANGLMGGKGVKVFGEHLLTTEAALDYCQTLINRRQTFIVEEKCLGPEFSLISLSDGKRLIHMPLVQDHKRAWVNNVGPNTGGMGSYSCSNHSLPFLSQKDIQQAQHINETTMAALQYETKEPYIGFLYGGFMATASGVKLIEFNARLGDPEAMNLLSLLDGDFLATCQGMAQGELHDSFVKFLPKATVCKYAAPKGYPDKVIKNQEVIIDKVEQKDNLFFASIEEREKKLYSMGSRTIAALGIADTLAQAEKKAETLITQVQGSLFHRPDIGTRSLINRRIAHMNKLRDSHYPLL
jgi:phosphoribosylamine--glycine ligase